MAKQVTELTDRARRAEELTVELGLDPIAAGLVAAVEFGDAMVDDIEFDPPLTAEARRRLGLDMSIEERIAEAERQVRASAERQ